MKNKMIETYKDYDWIVLKWIDWEVLKLMESNIGRSMTEIQKEVIEEVDKITDFKKVEADMERVTGLEKGEKIITVVQGYDDVDGRSPCGHLKVFTIKRLKIQHFGMPINDIRVEVVETTHLNEWGINEVVVYNLDRLTKMLSKKR